MTPVSCEPRSVIVGTRGCGSWLAATVDYLFGFDATTGVVDDWMYETLTREYVQDPQVAAFMKGSNPWARQGIAERLAEPVQRGLWADPTRRPCRTRSWRPRATWRAKPDERRAGVTSRAGKLGGRQQPTVICNVGS
jgi:hypothetical protein